jgi:hypothetical protein
MWRTLRGRRPLDSPMRSIPLPLVRGLRSVPQRMFLQPTHERNLPILLTRVRGTAPAGLHPANAAARRLQAAVAFRSLALATLATRSLVHGLLPQDAGSVAV